jgi:hypothetical protein
VQQRNILRRRGQQKFVAVVFHDGEKSLLSERKRLAHAEPARGAMRQSHGTNASEDCRKQGLSSLPWLNGLLCAGCKHVFTPPIRAFALDQFGDSNGKEIAQRFKFNPPDLPLARPQRHVVSVVPLGLDDGANGQLQQISYRESVNGQLNGNIAFEPARFLPNV